MSSVVCAETLPSAQFRPAPLRHNDVVLLSGFVSNQQQRLVRAYVACSTIDRSGNVSRFSLTTRLSEATPFRIERTRSSARISSTTSVSADISALQTGDQIRLRIVASNQQRRRGGACQPNRILATGNRQNGNQLTTTSNGNLAATRFTINKVGSGLLSYGSQFRLVQGANLAVTCPVRGNNPRCSVAPLNVGGLKDFEFRCTNGGTRFQRISSQPTSPSNPQGPQVPQGPIIPTPLPPVDLPVLPLPPAAPVTPAVPNAPLLGPNGLPFTPRILPPETITPVGPRTTPVVPPTSLPPIAVPVLPIPPTSDTFTLQDALTEQVLRNQLLSQSNLSQTAIETTQAQLADLQRRRATKVGTLAGNLKNFSSSAAQRVANDEIELFESVGILLNQGGGVIESSTFTDANAQRKRDVVAQLFDTSTITDRLVFLQQQFDELQKAETIAEDEFIASLRARQQALQRQQSSSETQKAVISKYVNDVSNLIALRRAQRVTQKNQVAKQVQNAINGQLPSTTSPARQPNSTPTTSAPTTTTTSTTPSSTNIFDPRTGQRIITTVPTSTPTTPTTPINSNFLGQLAALPTVQRSALVSGGSSVLADGDDSDSSSLLSIGAWIGIAIAALVLIALIAGLIYYFVAVAQKNKAAAPKTRAQQRVQSPQIRS